MSTLTDLQRNKCNILPREIITYDPLDSTMKLFIVLNQKKKKKSTKHARTQTHSVMMVFTLVTTFLLRCIYLRFLDSMFRLELWGRVRKMWQTATELNRPRQTLGCRLVTSRPATVILQVVLRSVTFCHVLLRSPRSTTAHLRRSIAPWLPWQIF